MICITLFDRNGFRGAGHRGGNQHDVVIDGENATPGYLAGAIPAGKWTVQLDTHMIMPGEAVRYQLEIMATPGESVAQRNQKISKSWPALRGKGWYRGELHSHTLHSDANRPLSDLIACAKAVNLDFLFVTDHNTISHLVEMAQIEEDDLLLAGGLELTTFFGHALCLGTREWVDWRVRPGTMQMAEIATQSYTNDHLFIIAHPEAIGDPSCTGCRWRYGEMMPGTSHLVEIWNGPWGDDSNNEQALSLWYDWLNQGRKLIATAGSDTHDNNGYAKRPGFNVIYTEELSERALLNAIRAGHLYLSSGPQLKLTAHSRTEQKWMMGDTVDRPVAMQAVWEDCPEGATLRVIANGRLQSEQVVENTGDLEWDVAPEQTAWVLVEVRSAAGEVLAITNPIWLK